MQQMQNQLHHVLYIVSHFTFLFQRLEAATITLDKKYRLKMSVNQQFKHQYNLVLYDK